MLSTGWNNSVRQIFFLCAFLLFINPVTDLQALERTYNFGVPPFFPKDDLEIGFKPFVEQMAGVIKAPIDVVITKNYGELIEYLKSGKVDFAIIGPVQYVEAKLLYPELVYIATTERTIEGRQRAYYFSHIIVRKDSGIDELHQLKRKSFAFIDPLSSSGYRFPMMYLYKKNIKPELFFNRIDFAGTHSLGLDMLISGKIDALATYDQNLWNGEKKFGKIFKSLARIGPIVYLAVVANHTVPKKITTAFQQALSHFNPDELPENFPYSGFQVLSDKSYENVREIVNFPFLDKLSPTILNGAVESNDLNAIFKAFDDLKFQRKVIREFIGNELYDKTVTFTGERIGIAENVKYENGWQTIKRGYVLSIENGRRVYVKGNYKFLKLKKGETARLKGKIVGIKGNDNIVFENVVKL